MEIKVKFITERYFKLCSSFSGKLIENHFDTEKVDMTVFVKFELRLSLTLQIKSSTFYCKFNCCFVQKWLYPHRFSSGNTLLWEKSENALMISLGAFSRHVKDSSKTKILGARLDFRFTFREPVSQALHFMKKQMLEPGHRSPFIPSTLRFYVVCRKRYLLNKPR